MPLTEARKRWDKENTTFIGLKLNNNQDTTIIDYLEDKPKQTTIKAALREYMARHTNENEQEETKQ